MLTLMRQRNFVFGSYGTTLALMSLGGMSVASGMGNTVGIVPMMYLSATLSLLAGVLAVILLRNRDNTSDISSAVPTSSTTQ